MTAPTIAPPEPALDVEQRVQALALLWANDEWSAELETELYAIAHLSRPHYETWALFEDLADTIRLREDVNEGRAHWDEVEPELTCADRSEVAHQIMCGRVDDAVHALIGRRA